MSLKSGIYKHRRTVRRVVAGVVVLCCLWAVYIRYVSPTRVALVNFPAYQASSIALANESRWVRVDVLTVEEAAKIGRYDVALFFGPGLRLNGDQAADIEAAGMNLLISGRHTTYMLDRNRRYTDDIVYRLRNTVTIVDRPDDIAEPMLKISGQIDEGLEDIAPALLKKWGSRLTATVSGRDWFDFTAANKGMGMRMLMERTGISKEEAAAFGDNFNDETMLDSVGHPFLMQHANPALRKPGIHLCEKELPVLRQLIETGTFPESGFIG